MANGTGLALTVAREVRPTLGDELNGSDAKLMRLYVVQLGSWVQDDCPNAPAPGQLPAPQ